MSKNQINLAEELKDILDSFGKKVEAKKERALDKASDYLILKLKFASPVNESNDTGKHFKDSWVRTGNPKLKSTRAYTGVRYIGNSKVTNQNIPLINLIEFSKNGHPFVRRTFEENKPEIINIIKGELDN